MGNCSGLTLVTSRCLGSMPWGLVTWFHSNPYTMHHRYFEPLISWLRWLRDVSPSFPCWGSSFPGFCPTTVVGPVAKAHCPRPGFLPPLDSLPPPNHTHTHTPCCSAQVSPAPNTALLLPCFQASGYASSLPRAGLRAISVNHQCTFNQNKSAFW